MTYGCMPSQQSIFHVRLRPECKRPGQVCRHLRCNLHHNPQWPFSPIDHHLLFQILHSAQAKLAGNSLLSLHDRNGALFYAKKQTNPRSFFPQNQLINYVRMPIFQNIALKYEAILKIISLNERQKIFIFKSKYRRIYQSSNCKSVKQANFQTLI